MMSRHLLAAAGLAIAGLAPVAAHADTASAKTAVDAAKAVGIVGEQADGYLGFVKPAADPALKAAVAEINSGRAEVYRKAAAANGVDPTAAAASAFKTTIFPRIPAGQYYRDTAGAWVRK